MLKKIVGITAACIVTFSSVVFAGEMPQLTAHSAIVIDATTGRVLYEKNAEETRYPASTTKMMTLIVALENGNLNDLVTTSSLAAETEGSSLWLTAGEKLKLIDMLYGMMLVSGNDATVAVAEHIGGSVENFAKMMTAKAHQIGAVHTNFTNTSGLPDPNHYSTAADLARIAAYGYKNPVFTQIVSTEHKVLPWAGKDHDRDLYNENRMLWLYQGGNGVKTGYTDAAGRCLVSGALRQNVQLVAVVLDSDHMWEDSIKLLDYGFSLLKPLKIINKGDIFKTVPVSAGKSDSVRLVAADDVVIPVSKDGSDEFQTMIDAPQRIDAPVNKGEKIGSVKVLYNNAVVKTVDLIAYDTAEKKSFFSLVWGSVYNFFSHILNRLA
ncbi:MAG: Serine-type D-Ala-D-Ala carboxypeptidase [Firmicutes bacterium]|nr:Serine-type D-Ala-D-Ala carboxypeptidase [Bacillota bacterium]